MFLFIRLNIAQKNLMETLRALVLYSWPMWGSVSLNSLANTGKPRNADKMDRLLWYDLICARLQLEVASIQTEEQ